MRPEFCGAWTISLVVALGLASVCAACGAGEGATSGAEGARVIGRDQIGGDVVSTVDGHAITRQEVEEAARAASVSPTVALRRLQDEYVLSLAAERAGWGDDAQVSQAGRRALVQALLARSVEAGEVEIDPAQIEAAYEANSARFDAPERRNSLHVLALTGGPNNAVEAQRWIMELHAELSRAPDVTAAALAVRHRQLDSLPFGVLVQEVEGNERAAGADPAYLSALFELREPGLVPVAVQTSLGWHVIVLTHIEPGRSVGRVEATLTLREERTAVIRANRLGGLVHDIVQEHPVVVQPEAGRLLENSRIVNTGAPGGR